MLSVLVPAYNCNVTELIAEVHRQLVLSGAAFEIIVMDDGSEPEYVESNRPIINLSQTQLIISEKNHGRIKTRLLLRDRAKFNWLLYLDADTFPKSEHFIINYLNYISPETQVIFGGIAYEDTPPESVFMLRWRYGRKHEEVKASIRNKTPYKLVISGNFLIKNKILSIFDMEIKSNQYGYDSYFGVLLKKNQVRVVHIDNEVYHRGIEESAVYLKKMEQAAKTLLSLYDQDLMREHQNTLLNLFIFLKKTYLNRILSLFYQVFRNAMNRNLTGHNPSIWILQLYRISYLCHIDLNR
ncbi:MAG: glycosyltransferase [Flavobacteriaceae bacterium]|nr:glycosyltransferase [Bacteroidia bacterium]MBT8288576.1 glycosyltransferase [Bacteroidia bacterium]NNF76137.1 glycosyltransferase [Flavobacteriaceae bacterium]NNK72927.1 glycosyltransferase [Flavobacteriaceae bacterium]